MSKIVLRIGITLLVLAASTAEARIETVLGSLALQHNQNLPNFIPETTGAEIIISREQYVISYNRQRRSPNWVAWKLDAKDIGNVARTNVFSKDPDLAAYLTKTGGDTSVDSKEYVGTCFDRGHQVPSRDRTDNDLDNRETFLTSNIIPQTVYLNRSIWEHLEQHTRDRVEKDSKTAYVIAGPIYDEDFGSIGPNSDIPIPSKDFKIVFLLDAGQGPEDIGPSTEVISVIMPNVLHDGTKPIGKAACTPPALSALDRNDWTQHKSSVTDIQKLSGIRFVKRP